MLLSFRAIIEHAIWKCVSDMRFEIACLDTYFETVCLNMRFKLRVQLDLTHTLLLTWRIHVASSWLYSIPYLNVILLWLKLRKNIKEFEIILFFNIFFWHPLNLLIWNFCVLYFLSKMHNFLNMHSTVNINFMDYKMWKILEKNKVH